MNMIYRMKDAEKSEQKEAEFGGRKQRMGLSPVAPLPHVKISGSPTPRPSSCPSRPSCQREHRGLASLRPWVGNRWFGGIPGPVVVSRAKSCQVVARIKNRMN